MRFAPLLGLLSFGSFCLVAACVGGPGSIDQGGDNGDQYTGVSRDTSGSGPTADPNGGSSGAQAGTSSGNPGGNTSGNASGNASSSSSSGMTYQAQPDLSASGYDQSCQENSDCTAVQEGAICTGCFCNNAAVKSSDAVKFAQERNSRISKCDPSLLTGNACAPCDAAKAAQCDEGTKKCVYR